MATEETQHSQGRIANWFGERIHSDRIVRFFAKKTVPQHKHSVWYYMGGITLFLVMLQVVTGVLLLLYYRPSAEQAFESVKFIVNEVEFGWLIQSLHSWGSNLLIFFVFIHLFSTFLTKSYHPPRELTWMSGLMLFGLMLFFGFTGYLLPWNELSLAATKVGTEIAGSVPFIGETLKEFLRGGEEVTGATLTRMFGFHVAIMPMILTLLLFVHLALVQIQGMSEPLSWKRKDMDESEKRRIKFFPNFFYRDLIAWLFALWILATIASLFPWELGQKADLFASTPEGVKPEWYFMFMFVALEGFHFDLFGSQIAIILDKTIVIVIFGVLGMLLFLIPFLDRKARLLKSSPIITGIGWFAIIYIVTTTVYGILQ